MESYRRIVQKILINTSCMVISLRYIHQNILAEHMAKDNPILLAFVIQYLEHNKLEQKAVNNLLRMKRAELTKAIGISSYNWCSKYLAKIQTKNISKKTLQLVKQSLSFKDVCSFLNRFGMITEKMLINGLRANNLLACKFIQKIPHDVNLIEKTLITFNRYAHETIKLGRLVYEQDIEEFVLECKNIKELKLLNQELSYKYSMSLHMGIEILFDQYLPISPLK